MAHVKLCDYHGNLIDIGKSVMVVLENGDCHEGTLQKIHVDIFSEEDNEVVIGDICFRLQDCLDLIKTKE
ncbi:hypothetical protein K413DRAFT_4638 [Clostridium sp. ASBs410]|nr:hypothetical protein K413DRAFT_4638 [Clostridium sp. ASBs410]